MPIVSSKTSDNCYSTPKRQLAVTGKAWKVLNEHYAELVEKVFTVISLSVKNGEKVTIFSN